MKIMITSRSFGKYDNTAVNILRDAGYDINMNGACFSQNEFEKNITEYDALIIGTHPFPAPVLEKCRNLKIICKHGVGIENIPVEKCKELGIAVCNTPGVNSNAVADLTFGLIIAAARNIVLCDRRVHEGIWKTEAGVDVYNKTLGVLGYGAIAKNVIRRAKGFDMKVLIYNHRRRELEKEFESYAEFCPLEDLFKNSDIISIHLPLTKETGNLIAKEQFMLMKDGVVLVNTARGGIVNETDLYEACRTGKVRAAAIDTSIVEPMEEDNPLRTLSNVILTPHLGMHSKEAISAVGIMCAKNAAAVVSGQPLMNQIC